MKKNRPVQKKESFLLRGQSYAFKYYLASLAITGIYLAPSALAQLKLSSLKENFPEGEGKVSNEVILARLENMAPGFKEWSKVFQEKPQEN